MDGTPGHHPAARRLLLGAPGRAIRAAAQSSDGGALRYVAHERLRSAQPQPGDRVYFGGFADGKLALLGRVVVREALEPAFAAALLGEPIAAFCAVGGAPYTECRADRIVPHETARALRTAAGQGLRFTRTAAYELHPGALLGVTELHIRSAEALDALLEEVAVAPELRYSTLGTAQVRPQPAASHARVPSYATSTARGAPAPRPHAARDAEIVARHSAGETMAELARQLGLSAPRIGQIVARARTGDDSSGRERISDADMADAIRTVAARAGRVPTASEYREISREAGLPSVQTIQNRFGGWKAAVRAAGMTPRVGDQRRS